MSLRDPLMLVLMLPWAALCFLFFKRQGAALAAVDEAVAPRFRDRVTVFRGRFALPVYAALLFVCGALCLVSLAGPESMGTAPAAGGDVRPIVFVVDASLSMLAQDTVNLEGAPSNASRLAQAAWICRRIMQENPSVPAALSSYSGLCVLHSPFTRDHEALRQYLGKFQEHAFERTGSDFRAALEAPLRLSTRPGGARCQVVLLSDGEDDEGRSFDDELKALAKLEIPVHTVALGSAKGVRLSIRRPEDILKGVKSKKPYVWKTAKTTGTLESIAKESGGRFVDMEKARSLAPLLSVVKENTGGSASILRAPMDRSYPFLAAALALFLLDTIFLAVLRLARLRRHGVMR